MSLAGCGGEPSRAPVGETPAPATVAFRAADRDGDGLVFEAELARDMALAFASADADGDGFLGPGELGEGEGAPPLDVSGDGRLSFAEVMAGKLDDLAAADSDGNGGLSPAEVAAFERDRAQGLGASALVQGNGVVGGLAGELLAAEPTAAALPEGDAAARRRADYERQSTLQAAALERRARAQELYERWRGQAGGGVAVAVPPAVDTEAQVRSAQRMLALLGYFTGPADGLLGPGTRAAVGRFQADQGLAATGEVDMALLERLRRAL